MGNRIERSEREVVDAMQRFGGMVYTVALAQTRCREDAQDVAQDVFVRLYTCDQEFRDDDHLRAWLLRITVNRSLDVHRSAWRRRVQALPEESFEYEATCPRNIVRSPEDELLERLESMQAWQALRQLPDSLRAVAVLYYVQECSVREIAGILQCREGTVRVRLARARKRMREVFLDETRADGRDGDEKRGVQAGSRDSRANRVAG